MKLLNPGTGNQSANRKKAVQYIVENIIDADKYELGTGNITSKDGTEYHVSAYAESSAAFVSTPGMDRSKGSIYASGLITLMFRQLKGDKRSFIYEVDPAKIHVKPNLTSAEWSDIDKVSTRVWICTDEQVKLIDRRT
jgi:hypothetical protein